MNTVAKDFKLSDNCHEKSFLLNFDVINRLNFYS